MLYFVAKIFLLTENAQKIIFTNIITQPICTCKNFSFDSICTESIFCKIFSRKFTRRKKQITLFIKHRCRICSLLHYQTLMGVETPLTFLPYHLKVQCSWPDTCFKSLCQAFGDEQHWRHRVQQCPSLNGSFIRAKHLNLVRHQRHLLTLHGPWHISRYNIQLFPRVCARPECLTILALGINVQPRMMLAGDISYISGQTDCLWRNVCCLNSSYTTYCPWPHPFFVCARGLGMACMSRVDIWPSYTPCRCRQ